MLHSVVFHLSMASSIPDIFTVKVESCPKLCQILDFLLSEIFRGQYPQKLYMRYHPHLVAQCDKVF